jgi:protein-disulfide isomerase
MKIKLDSVITATFLICALVTTGAIVHREFFEATFGRARMERKPVLITDWREDLATGVHMGSADAPVQLIEFADFECPFCGSFHKSLKSVRQHYPTQVALTYVHFPLPMHRFAVPAARAAECAGNQGRFDAMHDQLFEHQDDFGLRPWSEFAIASGVSELAAFDSCMESIGTIPRVVGGKALGDKLDIQGTPTVIINGWKLGHPPNADELDGMVKAILAGRSPVTSDGKFAK